MKLLGRCALAAGLLVSTHARAQCGGCSNDRPAVVDAARAYTLTELVGLALLNHPATHSYRERQQQRASEVGVAASEWFPLVGADATVGRSRSIDPFPRSVVPDGYAITQLDVATPELTLQYLLLDFGGRGGRIDAAKAAEVAAAANLVRENQVVAFGVAAAYYRLLTQEEALEAARQTLATAQLTLEAAEAQLATGRVTAPDVLNARASAAQARYDLESAAGAESIAHIALMEAVGAEPSPHITIAPVDTSSLPRKVTVSVNELLDRAVRDRPDLQAAVANVRQQEAAAREATSAYFPTASLTGSFGRTWEIPRDDGGEVGPGSAWTWAAGLAVRWTVFDGGARKNRLEAARARQRALTSDLREDRDRVAREVWTAYIAFVTATRKEEAASVLLEAATASYSASLEAYRLGARSIVDVVTAQRQLATARLASVAARSELLVEAVDLELVTGNLLRGRSSLTGGGPT